MSQWLKALATHKPSFLNSIPWDPHDGRSLLNITYVPWHMHIHTILKCFVLLVFHFLKKNSLKLGCDSTYLAAAQLFLHRKFQASQSYIGRLCLKIKWGGGGAKNLTHLMMCLPPMYKALGSVPRTTCTGPNGSGCDPCTNEEEMGIRRSGLSLATQQIGGHPRIHETLSQNECKVVYKSNIDE